MENILKNKEKYMYGEETIREKYIHIGYGINDKYARCMASSIASFCLNNQEKNFCFHVISTKLDINNKNRLKKLAQMYKIDILLYEINIDFLQTLHKSKNWSIAIYYRIFLPLLIDDVRKLIYIDADIICLKAANTLFNIDLSNEQIIAAVASVKWFSDKQNKILKLPLEHKYFNSGVLIIDIAKWNNYKVFEKFIKLIREKQKLNFPDQDILNYIFINKIKFIDKKYNYTKSEKMLMKDIVLRHFASYPKPWTKGWYLLSDNMDEKDSYIYYEQHTPWAGMTLENPKSYGEILIYTKLLWNNKKLFECIIWSLKLISTKLKEKINIL